MNTTQKKKGEVRPARTFFCTCGKDIGFQSRRGWIHYDDGVVNIGHMYYCSEKCAKKYSL